MKKTKNTKKTTGCAHFHAKLDKTLNRRFEAAVRKAPESLRIKNKTDLFHYMLQTFLEAVE